MNKEDVFYNIRLSFDFYFREVFCKKYGFYDTKEKKYQKVTKNKKYELESDILLTDGNGNSELNIYVTSGSNSISDSNFIYNCYENTITFNSSFTNVTISYNVLNVDVTDVYPEDKSDDFDKQMISISLNDFYSKPFEVTGEHHRWSIPFYIDLFLFNRVIRNRLSGALSVMFKSISMPIIDFSVNNIINADGTVNKNFSLVDDAVTFIDKFGDLSTECNDLESLDKKKMYSCTVSGTISVIF